MDSRNKADPDRPRDLLYTYLMHRTGSEIC